MVERYQPEKAADSKRDRSPSFPFIPLQGAIERLVQFEEYFKHHPAPALKVGLAWKMKENSSQALQTVAALKAFGLLESRRGSGKFSVSDSGRTYIRASQESVREDVLKRAALKPTLLGKYWEQWGADRPPDPVCLDELVLRGSFTQASAENFLKVYDATIGYAKLAASDKVNAEPVDSGDDIDVEGSEAPGAAPALQNDPLAGKSKTRGIKLMDGERELTTGLLSKGASFRLLVSGHVGEKEIDRLIRKLELDKEILAEPENGNDEAAN